MLEAEIGNIHSIMNIDHVKIIVGCIYRMYVSQLRLWRVTLKGRFCTNGHILARIGTFQPIVAGV